MNAISNAFTAGAFKIMPCSPKDAKSMNTTADSNANASENSDKRNEGIPPSTVFNFNTVPSANSKFFRSYYPNPCDFPCTEYYFNFMCTGKHIKTESADNTNNDTKTGPIHLSKG